MSHPSKNQFNSAPSSLNIEDNQLRKLTNKAISPSLELSPREPQKLEPQQIVGNCYQVIKQLDRDRSITAYLVEDLQDRQHAVRILELIYDENVPSKIMPEEVFHQRVGLIKKLSTHVQIPKLVDHFIENQQYYVVYEHTKGQVLASLIQQRILNEAETVKLLQDIARIYEFALKNHIVDFQLLPNNILQCQLTQRYILGDLKQLFWSHVSSIPLTRTQQIDLFHQQLECLGTMVIQSLIGQYQDRSILTQGIPRNWYNQISLSPRLQTILARMVALPGCDRYNSLSEITADLKPLLRIQQVIGEKYRLIRYLGEKEGIKTYLARNISEKKLNSALLIVKHFTIPHCDLSREALHNRQISEVNIDNLEQEVQKLQQLSRIEVIDLVRQQAEEHEELYLVRDYVEGISLTKRLNQQKSFSAEEVTNVLENALKSLSLIHQQGLIHRNIKHSNLIFAAQERTVVFVDFGILQTIREGKNQTHPNRRLSRSRLKKLPRILHQRLKRLQGKETYRSDDTPLQQESSNSKTTKSSLRQATLTKPSKTRQGTTEIAQTVVYNRKPPEQIVGRPTTSSDIYALGIVMIEILTGLSIEEVAQNSASGKEVWQEKLRDHPSLIQIMQKMICPDVEQRYQFTEEILQDLQKVKQDHLRQQNNEPRRSLKDRLVSSITSPKGGLIAIAGTLCLLGGIEFVFPVIRPQYHVNRGKQQLRTQPKIALNHFETALKLQPNQISALQGKGDAHLALQQFIPALKTYEQVLVNSPERVATWQRKGDVFYHGGEFKEALTAYDRALAIEPENPVILARKGRILALLSRYQDALSIQEKALEKDSFIDVELLSDAAGSALALKKNHQALNILNRVQSIAPLQPYLWQDKVTALGNLQQPQEALESTRLILESYEQALAEKPKNIELWLGKGAFLLQLQRHAQALNTYQKAIAIEPDSHPAWLGISQVFLAKKQYSEAFQAVEKAIQLKPQSFIAWYTRGSILQQGQQDLEQAVASYDRAIALNQDFFPAWRDRSSPLIAQNNYSQAVKSLQKAVTLAPQDLQSWLSLSNAFQSLEKIEEAVKALDQAIFLQPRNSNHWLQKGSLWEKQQKYTKACDVYRQAMKIAPDLTITGAMQKVGCDDD